MKSSLVFAKFSSRWWTLEDLGTAFMCCTGSYMTAYGLHFCQDMHFLVFTVLNGLGKSTLAVFNFQLLQFYQVMGMDPMS